MKKLSSFLTMVAMAIMLSVPVLTTYNAEAKGFSSSRSSSFNRSAFRSNSSRSNSSSSSSSRSSKRPSSGFWSSGKKAKSIKTPKKVSLTQQRQAKRTKNVLNQQRQEKKFKKPAKVPGLKTSGGKRPSRVAANKAYRDTYRKNPVFERAGRSNSRTYYDRRNQYIGGYNPPVYVYNSSPSFGMWDTIFLYSMLNNMNSNNHAAQFAHHQQRDPGYQQWRQEAEVLAKDNADLRKQLVALDAQSAKFAGTPVDPSKLPDGVDADIALASAAREAALPILKVCVGSETGAYFLATAGIMAPNVSDVNIIPVTTAGTGQALEYITAGKCDAAWVQSDGYWNYIEDNETTDLPFTRLFSPYREGVHVFCHEDGPSKISQLSDDHKLWFPKGSGAAVTFRNWIGEDDGYEDIQTVLNSSMEVASNEAALMKVSQNKNSCMMYVAAPGATEFVKKANKSAKAMKIVLIDINDGDFNDTEDPSGKDVYNFMEFDQKLYGNLTRQAGALWGGGDIQTLDMAADFVVSTKWQKANEKLYPSVALSLTALEPRIKEVVKPRY